MCFQYIILGSNVMKAFLKGDLRNSDIILLVNQSAFIVVS